MTMFFRRDAALRLSAWDPAPEGGSMPSHLLNDSMSFLAVEETERLPFVVGAGLVLAPPLDQPPVLNSSSHSSPWNWLGAVPCFSS